MTISNSQKELWNILSEMDNHISDLYVVGKFLQYSLDPIEALEPDKAMNSVIASKEYLEDLQNKMDATFRKIWKKVLPEKSPFGPYFACIGENGVLKLPSELLKHMDWDEEIELEIKVNKEDNSIILTEALEPLPGGCMGDTLTEEQEKILQEEGLKGLFKMQPLWENEI